MIRNKTVLGGHLIQFGRSTEEKQIRRGSETVNITRKVTTCTVTDPNDNIVGSTTVALHFKDADSRRESRQFAFKKVMRSMTDYPKETKAEIWDDYISIVKNPKVKEEIEELVES